MRQLEPYDIFFMETPLPVDDIDGLAYLHDHSPLSRAAVLALHFLCNRAMSGHHGPSGVLSRYAVIRPKLTGSGLWGTPRPRSASKGIVRTSLQPTSLPAPCTPHRTLARI
jgi:hypothetical protein